ncbi:unnamed protein product [Allacma fusca]|uniref:Uncharacterized protein n=1 Tax=Allacma fusca TaxID=39272 RepID=A0A8J2PC80_9HEXA|nr:unnamed protein product [Allacma fusca]
MPETENSCRMKCDPFYCCSFCSESFRYWHGSVILFLLQIIIAAIDLFLPVSYSKFGPDVNSEKYIFTWRLSVAFGISGIAVGFLGIVAACKRKRYYARTYTMLAFVVTVMTYFLLILGVMVIDEIPASAMGRDEKRDKLRVLILYYSTHLAFNSYLTLVGYGLFRYCKHRRRRLLRFRVMEHVPSVERILTRPVESLKSGFTSCASVDINDNPTGCDCQEEPDIPEKTLEN